MKINDPAIMCALVAIVIAVFAMVLAITTNAEDRRNQKDTEFETENTDITTAVETLSDPVETTTETEIHTETEKETVVETEPMTEPVVYYFTEDEVFMLARILYTECRGVDSTTNKAAVAWVVCNRADETGSTIAEVITKPHQFAYNKNAPIWDELFDLALDVLNRWNKEKNGEINVGRVLPKEYTYFHGDGAKNHFRNAYKEPYSIWDFSLPSPYEN